MIRAKSVRRLAAVLVADVANYTALMGVDEAGTHDLLISQRELVVDPEIDAHSGRIVKSTGDGVMVEFPSVIAAVNCAVELQAKLIRKNQDVPHDRKLRWRIGINYGDIIVESNDIYGDSVNIAARLEALAEPDGICISEKVFREVRAKIGVTFESIGEQRLKNIVEPVTVYRSSFEMGKKTDPFNLVASPSRAPLSDRPSVAILPFVNLSPGKGNQYLVDGLTEELIIDLSMSPEFFVIDRGSSFIFGGRGHDLRDIASKLGVRYLVMGSLQQGEDRIRVTSELIEADTGIQLWTSRYDRRNPDLLEVVDEIARSIAASLMTSSGQIAKAELKRQVVKAPKEFTVYDHYLRARDCFHKSLLPPWDKGKDWSRLAMEKFTKTIEMSDPPYWPAVAGLAWQHAIDFDWDYSDDHEASGRQAFEHALRAVKNEPDLHLGQWALGWAYLFYKHDHARAEHHYSLARELNVGDCRLLAEMAQLLILTGRYEQAIMNLNQAIRLHPYHEQWYDEFLGWAYEENGQPEQAVKVLGRFTELEGTWSYLVLARSYLQLGQADKVKEYFKDVDRLHRQSTGQAFTLEAWTDWVRRRDPYEDPDRAKRVIELTKAVFECANGKA
ncbi:MAG: adenylate/guanylate cyclase domain-containing protein [Anderseniella sp.]